MYPYVCTLTRFLFCKLYLDNIIQFGVLKAFNKLFGTIKKIYI